MKFQDLVDVCERLTTITKRKLMTDIVAEFLKHLGEFEVEPAVSMMLGRPFRKWDQRTLDVSWSTLSNIIRRLTENGWIDLSTAFRETGDFGAAAQVILEKNKVRRQATLFSSPLTVLEVRRVLEAISESTGHGSRERKERLIGSLFGRASPVEAKYLVKIMIGEMRTGFHEGLMEIAFSKAFSIPLKTVQTAVVLAGDIGEVAAIHKKHGREGLTRLSLKVFRPIKPMLAQTARNPAEALRAHGGETAFEYKLDGARIQIHKSDGELRIFSRRLTDVTGSLREIVQLIPQEVKTGKVILEGEVIALGKGGNPLPFQHLMRRFRRVYNIDRMIKEIPVKLYLFDVIFVDDRSLISLPYVERRKMLKETAGNISLVGQLITRDPDEAEIFLEESIRKGHEGLVAKRLESPYIPGVRGKHWFKIKKTLEPLDLAIVAAEYGYGRRHNWLSDYHLAAMDEDSGEFLELGKTFKGLTDREMEEMTIRLKEIAVEEKGDMVVVPPKIVVEVTYNEIQKSPKYKCGMALRFARIAKIREDKNAEDADTIQRVRQIYEKQFEKKARYL